MPAMPDHLSSSHRSTAELLGSVTEAVAEGIGFPCEFGNYTLLQVIDEGGFGEVYLAHDDRKGTVVAIKTLSKRRATDAVCRRRFDLETRIGLELRHPNILS